MFSAGELNCHVRIISVVRKVCLFKQLMVFVYVLIPVHRTVKWNSLVLAKRFVIPKMHRIFHLNRMH